jgi:hypothetical protein
MPVNQQSAAGWLERRTGITPTAPPTRRLSDEIAHDETQRPSAPEPDPDVVFTARGLRVGAHLIEVHDKYRAELAQLRDLLERVRSGAVDVGAGRGELQTMVRRVNAWALGGYCQQQCLSLTEHHSVEDASIFPHLRRQQPDLADVLNTLQREHRVIHALLDRVDSALIELAKRPHDLGDLSEAIDLLTDTVTSHFAYEERELTGPLSRFGFYQGQL